MRKDKEVRALVLELEVRGVRRALLFQRAIARVLHRERRGDDQHFGEAVLVLRRDHHAPDARVDGQLREPRADGGKAMLIVDGAELVQKLVAVGDHARLWHVEQRKLFDAAEIERSHAQDHGRQ